MEEDQRHTSRDDRGRCRDHQPTSRYTPFQPVTHVPKHGPELYFVAVIIDGLDGRDSATLFGLQRPSV